MNYPEMFHAGKLFALSSILALLMGVLNWPAWRKDSFYAITMGRGGTATHDVRVAIGVPWEHWAFIAGAIFAACAVTYYWFPILFLRTVNARMSQLHFWISAVTAFAFLFAPVLQSLLKSRPERTVSTAVLAIAVFSSLLFLITQAIFVVGIFCSAMYGKQ